MSRVAIFRGLGRHRRRRPARKSYRSYGRRRARKSGGGHRRKFAAAARVCAIKVKRAGRWNRRKFGDCIKNYLRTH